MRYFKKKYFVLSFALLLGGVILLILSVNSVKASVFGPPSFSPGAGSPDTNPWPLIRCGNNCPAAEGTTPDCCTICDFFETANRILIFIRNIAFIVGGLLLVVGGIMMLLTGFSESQQRKGKKIVTSTIVGLVIIMLSFIVITTILATFAPSSAKFFNLKGAAFEIECHANP